MGLITVEINELRQRLKNFDDGTIDSTELNAALNVYSQVEKRMRLYLQSMVIGLKLGLPVSKNAVKELIGGDGKLDVSPRLENRTAKRGQK